MSFVVRKITASKWRQYASKETDCPSADAITSCMRTSGNTLSVWLIKHQDELDDAVLAIASLFERLETIDVVLIELAQVEKADLCIEATPGRTHYLSFVDNHRDLSDLDYKSLKTVAEVIVESIRHDKSKRFTKAKVKKILLEGLASGKIKPGDLDVSLCKKLCPEAVVGKLTEKESASFLEKLREDCSGCQTFQQLFKSYS